MNNLSLDEAKDKILTAIANQRWFFFENKPKILMDKLTGILWANLDYFPYDNNKPVSYYKIDTAKSLLKKYYNIGNEENWSIPTFEEIVYIVRANDFPFCEGGYRYIKNNFQWFCKKNYGIITVIDLKTLSLMDTVWGYVLPCNYFFVEGTNYQDKMSNNFYSSKEKAQFVLALFLKNKLIPIFDNKEITVLYKKAYIEKSLVQVTKQVINTPVNFNYTDLLSKYNLTEIDKSVIKYYQSVSQWLNELLDNLDGFEQQKQNIINEFNNITLKLSSQLSNNGLSVEENNLL